MNPVRILRISNRYLFSIGFTIQKYSKKFQIYRRSILGIVIYLCFHLAYFLCLYEHYAKKALFETVKDLSQTIYYSLYAHLFLGIINMCVILWDMHAHCNFADRVLNALPKNGGIRWKFDRIELFTYYRAFVNLIVFICLVSYDLTIIDLSSLTRSKAMLFLGLYYPHCAIANSFRYFTIQMILLKNVCENLNKKLIDIQLPHEFRYHGLYFEYLKSENIVEGDETLSTRSACSWTSIRPESTVSTRFQDLRIQDNIFFCQWWTLIRNRMNQPRKMDIVQMLDAIQSDEYLIRKFNEIFQEYDHFMLMYRNLESLIQKQLFLVVCQHTIIVMCNFEYYVNSCFSIRNLFLYTRTLWFFLQFGKEIMPKVSLEIAIHILMEIYLEWGDLLDEKNVQLVKVNFITHLLQIVNDFGCMALTAIIGRNEIRKTKNISTKLMAMPFCDNIRCVVSYFHLKLQNFKEDIWAFKIFKINGSSFFMVILQYTILACIYAAYQYFDIKFENLQSMVDSMNDDDE